MTGVGWVQWLIDGCWFVAGLLIGALVLHEVQMWRAMHRRGGMLEDFRMVSTVNPQPFAWAWPPTPSSAMDADALRAQLKAEYAKGPTLHVIPPLSEPDIEFVALEGEPEPGGPPP